MKSRISQLMDSELPHTDAAAPLAALREEGEAREAWRMYHLISDALHETQLLSRDFAARVAARLAGEPTVLAPSAQPGTARERVRRFLLPGMGAAAAVAGGIALVGGLAFAPWQAEQAYVPVAEAPLTKPAVSAEPARVPPPAAADDYLLAHQSYSQRSLLQGVAPYVRTVSGEGVARSP